ncbi:fatty acid hydroxylase domain-containing protein 2-like [Glandiceps talaboti]
MEGKQVLCTPSCRPAPAVQPSSEPQADRLTQSFDSIKKYLFVTGTAICVFAAARNSITWHIQQCWGASGDFWQYGWLQIFNAFGGDPWILCVVGTITVTGISYWLFASLFLFVDVTGKPAFMLRYKVQPEKNIRVDRIRLTKAVLTVLFNQTFATIPVIMLFYHLFVWRGVEFGPELPTFQWVLVELIVFSLVEEVGFYYFHRLLHYPALYKYIHKVHHEWTAPISIVSLYAHPVEHVMSNILPPLVGPLLTGSHIATIWLWFIIALFSSIIAHCGYHVPFLPSPEAHDFHHRKFVNNYGVLGVLDRLHGTDNLFRASKAYQRHFMLLCWTPVLQQVPDDPKLKSK